MIDSVRPVVGKQHGAAAGPWDWQPSVGAALAAMIEETLVASLYRIGPRWLHIAEFAGGVSGLSVIVDPEAIPRSHQMDRAVVPALCQQGVLDVLADKQHKAKPESSTRPVAQPAGVGLRPVQYVWLGKETHGELWNWVRATSPADATVEEVSAQLFNDTAESHGEKRGDYLAFAMTSAPPLFGLPGHWAIKFDEGKAYAPANVSTRTDESEDNLVALAGSSLAEDQALREANAAPDKKGAKPVAGAGAAVGTLVQDAFAQAMYLKQTLASWHLDKAVDPTLAFLGRRMGGPGDASQLARWQPVLVGQKDKLSRIGAGIVGLDRAVATMGLSNKHGADAKPLRDILRIYADAAGASHLVQTSETLLQRAAALQAALPLRGVQSATRDLGASADMLRDSTPLGDRERDRLSGAAIQIDEDSHKLQSRMMRGDKVDPNEIDQVTVNAGEVALKSKVHAIAVQLEALEKAAHDAGDGFFAAIAALFSSDFRGLEFETQVLKDSLEVITRDMDWQAQAAGLGMRVENAKDLEDYNCEMMRVRKEALARAQGQFATMAANDRIKNFLSKGATLVKWQSFRTACVKLAVLIGVSLVGGAIGGMVARGIGGMLMSSAGIAAMQDLSMGTQMIARGSGLVTETAVTSVGQMAIFGDKLSDSFLENMLMSLGSAGTLKAIGHQAETLAQVERASEGLWAKAGAAGKLVLKEGAAITGHTIMGAALGYVSHKIVTGKTQPPPETLEEWLLQGASIAVGRYVGKAMDARVANAKKLAAIKDFAAGQKLLAATTALHEHALRAESNPQPKEAAELLAKRHEVLSDEIKALDELERSPGMLKASGLHLWEVRQMRADVHAQLAEVHSRAFAEAPLHLAGIEELIPGAQWKGSHEQIVAAIESAKHAGVKIEAKPPQGDSHVWHVELEGRPLEIVERESPSATTRDEITKPAHERTTQKIQAVDPPHVLPSMPEATRMIFTAKGDVLAVAAAKVPPEGGYFDVVVHGDPNNFYLLHNDNWVPVTSNSVRSYLRRQPGYRGQPIRLISCESGALTNGIAQSMANGMGVKVKAPTETVWIHFDGHMTVGVDPARVTGSWREFEPYTRTESETKARTASTTSTDEHANKHSSRDDAEHSNPDHSHTASGEHGAVPATRTPEFSVQRNELQIASRRTSQEWTFTIEAPLPNGRLTIIAYGSALLDAHGQPTSGPGFVFEKGATVEHVKGKVQVYDGDRRLSLSDLALDEATGRFQADFGHPPETLPGSLADENKANFQREYVKALRGATPEAAKQIAIRQISFGRARLERGYDDFTVVLGNNGPVDLGEGFGVQQVPLTIDIVAKRSSR